MELHHVIFDADGIHVRRITRAVVGFHLIKGFAFILLRFLLKDRIQRTIEQERIDRLPVPSQSDSALSFTSLSSNTPFAAFCSASVIWWPCE